MRAQPAPAAGPVPSTPERPARVGGVLVGASVAAVLGLAYLVLRPQAPDLPAQLARASAVSRGVQLWWAGWYGGINTSTYSLLSAHLMSLLGVAGVGVAATAVLCVCGADLVRTSQRPRAGAVAIALAACANLYSGRITFAAGMALGLASFCALRRGWRRAGLVAALLVGLLSPLAALCQLTALAALLLTDPEHRRTRLLAALYCGAPVGAISLVFGQPSYMPYSADTCIFALLACAGVAIAPVPRLVRALAAVSALIALGAWAVHSPVGSNAARMPMLAAAPLVVATARRGYGYGKALVAGLLVWPLVSLSTDMAIAEQPSSSPAFYATLLQHLPDRGSSTQRVEVLDPLTHGAAYYVSTQVPLARGWERQIDAANNPLFYGAGLTPSTYRAWLVQHAVGWVAVPSVASLDYSAVAERTLVEAGLPYLRLAWQDPQWLLYRVTAPAPAATGVLRATSLTDTGVDMLALAAGSGLVRVPYSHLLVVRSELDPTVVGCVAPDATGDSVVTVPAAGPYVLEAQLRGLGARPCPPPAPGP